MNYLARISLVAISLLATPAAWTCAQTDAAGDSQLESTDRSGEIMVGRNSPLVTSALAEVVDQLTASVVEIRAAEHPLCLGTIVSTDGLIVTKASELTHGQLQCRFHDGQLANLNLIATSTPKDLSLLQVEPESRIDESGQAVEFKPIVFHNELLQTESLQSGSFVVAIGFRGNKPMLGIVGNTGETFSDQDPGCADCIDLGLQCVEKRTWKPPSNSQFNAIYSATLHTSLAVQRVDPHSIAEQSGVLIGDELEQFNGKKVSSQQELIGIFESLKPGDEVTLVVNRDDRMVNLSTTISRNSKRIFQDLWGGGPFSRRRFGFSNVLCHDIPIQPEQCGGPLVDLHARTVGINVARSLRVATLAIQVEQVRQFVLANRPDAALVTLPGSPKSKGESIE